MAVVSYVISLEIIVMVFFWESVGKCRIRNLNVTFDGRSLWYHVIGSTSVQVYTNEYSLCLLPSHSHVIIYQQ